MAISLSVITVILIATVVMLIVVVVYERRLQRSVVRKILGRTHHGDLICPRCRGNFQSCKCKVKIPRKHKDRDLMSLSPRGGTVTAKAPTLHEAETALLNSA